MRIELENEEVPRYLRVYNYYKDLILSGKLQPDTKLPSIRKGAIRLQMSRTTMETAYMQLAAEGYIISRPQSGYYVTDIGEKQREQRKLTKTPRVQEQLTEYDFVTSNVDRESFRFDLWRRYMKSALRQDERLLSYGEPQGELEFREVLAQYVQEMRGVICSPDQIVVGAGVQSLLHILCPMIRERKSAAFYNPDFLQGKAVFEDYGFQIVDDYKAEGTGVYYISPSQMTKWGGVMAIAERMNLIKEASKNDLLIIEDDYNSEFRYFQKPTPALQGLAGGRGVVYLGTFSKMLLPSIRMSYMVLPPEFLEVYEKKKHSYNQTASKAEQIAITQFIRDGHLAGQIRKSRKIHMAKAELLLEAAKRVMGDRAKAQIGDSGFNIRLDLRTTLTSDELARRAMKEGTAVIPLPAEDGTPKTAGIVLACTNVAESDYEEALMRLKRCLDEEEVCYATENPWA